MSTVNKRILSIDPGGTTGLAFLSNGEITADQLGPNDHHKELHEKIVTCKPDVVIYEKFDWRPKFGRNVDLRPREYIGVIKLVRQEIEDPFMQGFWGIEPFELVPQGASSGKGFWTDDKMKRVGTWFKGKPHACDAARHLLRYLTDGLQDHTYLYKLRPNDEN